MSLAFWSGWFAKKTVEEEVKAEEPPKEEKKPQKEELIITHTSGKQTILTDETTGYFDHFMTWFSDPPDDWYYFHNVGGIEGRKIDFCIPRDNIDVVALIKNDDRIIPTGPQEEKEVLTEETHD